METVETEKTALLELWERRRVQFDQCMELQLFTRDCEHVSATMSKQEVQQSTHSSCTVVVVVNCFRYVVSLPLSVPSSITEIGAQ